MAESFNLDLGKPGRQCALPWRAMSAVPARLLRRWPLGTDRRGAVALWMGLTMPALIMAMAAGIEVSDWAAVKVELQRTADVAATAGVIYYSKNSGQANLAQNAATHAAYIAQINGASGKTSPDWTPATKTLVDNMITVQIVPGIKAPTDIAVRATVRKTISLAIGKIFTSNPAVTISASALAEVVVSSSGPQPCILGLSGDQDGVTTDIDVSLTGNANIDVNGCSVRSDGAVKLTGNAEITASGTYAAGAISTTGNSQVIGGSYQNAGQISDPYISHAVLQSALQAAVTATGPVINRKNNDPPQVLSPGSYTSISASGNSSLTLSPGLYYVNGNVSVSGNGTLTASGVTIVSTGTVSLSGNTVFNAFTAPTISGANTFGGIPGVLFASNSSSASSFTGNTAVPFTGLVYYPHGALRFTGNATDGSTGCSEIIANSVIFTGNANLGGNCSQYGTLTFGSVLTSSNALVE